jgi:RNA polymerase sporulation-specific sigma factor
VFEIIFEKLFAFALHLEEKMSFPEPLSAAEERMYLERMLSGDKRAKDVLIERNLRLVAHVVKKYYSANEDSDDLLSVGTIGLIKGVQSFDPSKGVRLATYAARCIDNEILMYFRNKKKTMLDISFEEPIEHDCDGNPLTLMDIVAQEDTVLDEICKKKYLGKLYDYIESMTDSREKQILILRYGLDGNEPMTQNEVARMLGISRSYVSRIETKIIKKIRKYFEIN